MKLILAEIPKKLNKAWLKQDLNREKVEIFKSNLKILFNKTESAEKKKEHEEHFKNIVSDFLKDTWYKNNYEININKRKDLVIHNGKSSSDSIAVIIEAKKPSNEAEMISQKAPNAKALHELVHYYLHERIINNNKEIKHIIATNSYDWFVFDAADFEKYFYENKTIRKNYGDWHSGSSLNSNTDWFYSQIAKPYIDEELKEIEAIHFNLLDYKEIIENSNPADDDKLINLYKVLSPEHLLKKPFANDSNSLNKEFYNELLHIIGLEERPDGGKKLIDRKKPEKRDEGSLLENTMNIVKTRKRIRNIENPEQYGQNEEDHLFSISLELCIMWLNRILFLKLLEGQLIKYHNGNPVYAFINSINIKDYDELDELFFEVLAIDIQDRIPSVNEKYGHIPYLNSSLFEISKLESETIQISDLKDRLELPIYPHSVLKNKEENKGLQKKLTLHYLFEFLEAYNFSSDSSAKIQEDNKTIINASVLGLIFEKINGYKDGSIFTPGFITMYMCRETIRRAVVQKFNDVVLSSIPKLEKATKSEVKTVETNLPPQLLKFAREMRKNQTDAEELLWQFLRNRQLNNWKFRRQHPMSEGFILDFYCAETRIAIELDGDYHNDGAQNEHDNERSILLEKYGITVIRFRNMEVLSETEQVLERIVEFSFEVGSKTSPPAPLQNGEGSKTPPTPLQNGEGSKTNYILPDKFATLQDVHEAIGIQFSRKQANDIINSIKICDPAVGSGHFLVSALNEIIAIKSELGVLCYRNGNRIKDYKIEVANDELVINDKQTEEIFQYHLNEKGNPIDYLQELQETLFHEKHTIIENCLFGVDINPKSVLICRLRLWIELLKNSYYKYSEIKSSTTLKFGENSGKISSTPLQIGEGPGVRLALETLPNIDINIKCGNSLISRFPLDTDLSKALKSIKYDINTYRKCVADYKNATNKDDKHALEVLINQIKTSFRDQININDPIMLRLNKINGELWAHTNQVQLFEQSPDQKAEFNKKAEKLATEKTKLEQEIAEIKNNVIYRNAFEWRFEFPEVLDDEGNFIGFDVVIGNPPYVQLQTIKEMSQQLEKLNYMTFSSMGDLYALFYEKGNEVLRNNGTLCFISGSAWMRANYGKELRKFFINHTKIIELIDLSDCDIFDSATVLTNILIFEKSKHKKPIKAIRFTRKDQQKLQFIKEVFDNEHILINEFSETSWIISDKLAFDIKTKVEKQGIKLIDWDIKINRGILTGFNDAFIIDGKTKDNLISNDSKSSEIIKPMLRGRDVKKFFYDFQDLWLIGTFPSKNINIDDYPAIKKYLSSFGRSIEQTGENGCRKKTNGKWFETQDSIAYWKDFEKPKIIYSDITKFLYFTFDVKKLYTNDRCFFITGSNLEYLVAFFNSSLFRYCFEDYFPELQGNSKKLIKIVFEQLPIKQISKEEQQPFIEKVNQIIKIKEQNPSAKTTHLEKEIDQLVYQLYGLTEEEIRIVEGA